LKVPVLDFEGGHALPVTDRIELDAEIGDETGGSKNPLDLVEDCRFHDAPLLRPLFNHSRHRLAAREYGWRAVCCQG
jgi:hypothetical protein